MFKSRLDGDQKHVSYAFYLRLSVYLFLAFSAGMYVSGNNYSSLSQPENAYAAFFQRWTVPVVQKPDLSVTEIILSPANRSVSRDCYNEILWKGKPAVRLFPRGSEICYLARVKNVGTQASSATAASLILDNFVAAEGPISPLNPGQEVVRAFISNKPVIGVHAIAMKVDPANILNDASRSNNEKTEQFRMGTGTVTVSPFNSPVIQSLIMPGARQAPLAALAVTVTDEPVTITGLKVRIMPSNGLSASKITNVILSDEGGKILAGPQNGTTVPVNTIQDLSYADTIKLPIGTTKIFLKGDVAATAAKGSTLQVGLANPGIFMITTGDQMRLLITPSPATTVFGTIQTIQGPALKVVTLSTPVAGTVVVGKSNYVIAQVSFEAQGGEDIQVDTLNFKDSIGGGDPQRLQDLGFEVFGDPDTTDTNTVTISLSQGSRSTYATGEVEMDLRTPLKISRSRPSVVILKATILRTAAVGVSHRLQLSGTTKSKGVISRSPAALTVSGTGQAQTIVAAGKLKVEKVARVEEGRDVTLQRQLVAGSVGNPIVSYRLTAYDEPIEVKIISLALAIATSPFGPPIVPSAVSPDISKVYLSIADSQTGASTSIGDASGYSLGATGKASASPTGLIIPVGGSKYLTIKADLAPKEILRSGDMIILGIGDGDGDASSWGANGQASAVGQGYGIVALGKDSDTSIAQATINSTAIAVTGVLQASYNMPVYDGVLTVSKRNVQQSPLPGQSDLLYLDLTAIGDTITVKDMEFPYTTTCVASGSSAALRVNYGSKPTIVTWASGVSWLGFPTGRRSFKIIGDENGRQRGAGGFDSGQSLVIGPGQTAPLVLNVNTEGCTTGQSLQISVGAGQDVGRTTNTTLASGISWYDTELGSDRAVDSTLTAGVPVAGNTINY